MLSPYHSVWGIRKNKCHVFLEDWQPRKKTQIREPEQNAGSYQRTVHNQWEEKRCIFGAGFTKSAALMVTLTKVSTISTRPRLTQFSINITSLGYFDGTLCHCFASQYDPCVRDTVAKRTWVIVEMSFLYVWASTWKPQGVSKEPCIRNQVKPITPTVCQTYVSKFAAPAPEASKSAGEVTCIHINIYIYTHTHKSNNKAKNIYGRINSALMNRNSFLRTYSLSFPLPEPATFLSHLSAPICAHITTQTLTLLLPRFLTSQNS